MLYSLYVKFCTGFKEKDGEKQHVHLEFPCEVRPFRIFELLIRHHSELRFHVEDLGNGYYFEVWQNKTRLADALSGYTPASYQRSLREFADELASKLEVVVD